MDSNELFDLYMADTRENLNTISQNLLDLESDTSNTDYIQNIFRAAHTIKGSSASLEFLDITHVTHKLEDLFGAIRDNKIVVCTKVIDVALKALDCLELLHEQIEDESLFVDMTVVEEIELLLSGDKDIASVEAVKAHDDGDFATADKTLTVEMTDSIFNKVETKEKLNINDIESLLVSAIESDSKVYYIHAEISSTCDYKGVRVFMLLESLASHGEIIAADPTLESVEKEDFEGNDVNVILLSDSSEEVLSKVFTTILEIDVTECSQITVSSSVSNESISEDNLSCDLSESKEDTTSVESVEKSTTGATKRKQPKQAKESNLYVRVHTKTLDTLMNEEGELLLEYNRLRLILDKGRRGEVSTSDMFDVLDDISGNINKIIGTQQSIIMSTRMFPLEQLFQVFPRMIRDLSGTLNKPVDLIIEGQDTELDRTILEKVSDPLKHIIRNAIDHGVEMPEDRIAAGKSEKGTIKLSAKQESNSVVITVQDDGKGMDKEVLKRKAVEKGLYSEAQVEKLGDEEVYGIIFMPGFSTASEVTEVSGRGVGMDIVKSCLSEIGGVVLIDSELGKGTTFTVKIPLTLAISQALLVTVEDNKYIVLLNYIQEVIDVNRARDIKRIQHKDHIVIRGDKIYPLIYLREVYGHPHVEKEEEKVILIQNNGREIGLVADDWIGQQDIVVKSLNKYFKGDVKYESGITKLGDGSIPIIIDIPAIMEDF